MKIKENLINSIRNAAQYNSNVEVKPACILWTDGDEFWKEIILDLQEEMSELYILGKYNPKKKTGPAIWLRCIVDGTIEGMEVDKIPVLYLPGKKRDDLRNTENCSDLIKPLVELQYRGTFWSHENGKDWTIYGYLTNEKFGLGLNIGRGEETKKAMRDAIGKIINQDIDQLAQRELGKSDFNNMLVDDPSLMFLNWLNEDKFSNRLSKKELKAFKAVMKSEYKFDLSEGKIEGVKKLLTEDNKFDLIWNRFCENPSTYKKKIFKLMEKCKPPRDHILWNSNTEYTRWPQWNFDQEKFLEAEFKKLVNAKLQKLKTKILELEEKHKKRRELIWARLGDAKLAQVLEPLAFISNNADSSLATGTLKDIEERYKENGWKIDAAVLKILEISGINKSTSKNIKILLNRLYHPWVDNSAKHLQNIWKNEFSKEWGPKNNKEENCLLFVDGLRYDCARRLQKKLEENYKVESSEYWAALPSVTATGKPAAAPITLDDEEIISGANPSKFEVISSNNLKKKIEESGYKIVSKKETFPSPDDTEKIWIEIGNIDHEGHDKEESLPEVLENIYKKILELVKELQRVGWKKVKIVTDHGWLLLPEELPKIELSKALAERKWGRCAYLKSGAKTDEKQFSWYWNPQEFFVLASGVNCFIRGKHYSHGGLSIQECFICNLEVTLDKTPTFKFEKVKWAGLRCKVEAKSVFKEGQLEIRLKAGDPNSTVGRSLKSFKEKNKASVIIEDDELEGKKAYLVLVDENCNIIAQQETKIGGEY
jgi:hypothetical protein